MRISWKSSRDQLIVCTKQRRPIFIHIAKINLPSEVYLLLLLLTLTVSPRARRVVICGCLASAYIRAHCVNALCIPTAVILCSRCTFIPICNAETTFLRINLEYN